MTSNITLRVGTRGSFLATTQTQWVVDRLIEATGCKVETIIIKTRGDELQSEPGAPTPNFGVGLFTRALEQALERNEIDFAVHSLKDLPCQIADGFVIAAVPEREDHRDALCAPQGTTLSSLKSGAILGTGSPRRQAFIKALRPDLQMQPIRGNIDTRLSKIDADNGPHAIVLAVSGLKRAKMDDRIAETLDILPAPGQGTLGIECRADDLQTQQLLAKLDHSDSRICAEMERKLHEALGGGCLMPVGALGTREASGKLKLSAAIASLDGKTVLKAEATGEVDADLVAQVAKELMDQGAETLLNDIRAELNS